MHRRPVISARRAGWITAAILLASAAFAQQPANGPPAATADLSGLQQQLLRDYERFEKSLFDVAEQARHRDPDRAELLYRARSQSQEQSILSEMTVIAELLRSQSPAGGAATPQYGPAADRQEELIARMEGLLKLLQSLDDRERIAAEIARLQELIKDNARLIARQKDVRADTQRGRSADQMKEHQERVADEAKRLAEKIDRQDQNRSEEGAPPELGQDGKSTDGKSPEGKAPSPSAPGQPPQDSPMPQATPEGMQHPPGSQQNSGKNSRDSQRTPGREELEQARRQMQQAIQELSENHQEQAVDEQEEAISLLEKMKARLEEILRQLRQDEKESYLTLLEARFQNMLKREQRIQAETARLNTIEEPNRPQQNYASRTDNIRKEQEDNALEAGKALLLLKQEGSSVAFPEAVEQMYQNMRVVASRLGAQDTGQTTQLVEQLVVETLEEMISALRQELEKQQEHKQNPQQAQQGQPQTPSLVNQLAELKLIRSLQSHVNRLTQQIGTELDGKEPSPQQRQLIDDLVSRQQRIQEATYDLSVGRNQ